MGPDSPPASPPLPGLAYLPPSSLPGESARGEAGLDGGRTMRLARPARRRRGSLHLLREANGPRRARTGPGTSAGLGVGNTPRRTQKASGSPAPTAGVLPPTRPARSSAAPRHGQPGFLASPRPGGLRMKDSVFSVPSPEDEKGKERKTLCKGSASPPGPSRGRGGRRGRSELRGVVIETRLTADGSDLSAEFGQDVSANVEDGARVRSWRAAATSAPR